MVNLPFLRSIFFLPSVKLCFMLSTGLVCGIWATSTRVPALLCLKVSLSPSRVFHLSSSGFRGMLTKGMSLCASRPCFLLDLDYSNFPHPWSWIRPDTGNISNKPGSTAVRGVGGGGGALTELPYHTEGSGTVAVYAGHWMMQITDHIMKYQSPVNEENYKLPGMFSLELLAYFFSFQ